MRAKLKPLADQVVVVTNAASGLGLEIARQAAAAGAAVVLSGRDEAIIRAACEDIVSAGGRAHPVAADVSTDAGCDRVARAAAARFGRLDSWVDAGGEPLELVYVAAALVNQLGEDGSGALVAFGRRMGREARAALRPARDRVAATMVRLPRDWTPDGPAEAAARAALHATVRPMGHMAVAAKGRSLTPVTEARKHPVALSAGLLVMAGAALWFGRGRVARAAADARPYLIRKVVRPALLGAVRRRPLEAAKLVAKHPREAMRLARAVR